MTLEIGAQSETLYATLSAWASATLWTQSRGV